jgi:hypothetical protein
MLDPSCVLPICASASACRMMEDGSPYNNRLKPFELTGLQKYSVIYQDVISQTFWDALQVRPAPTVVHMPCRRCLIACTCRTNYILIMQEYRQLNKPILSFKVKMGFDSACPSDAARSWLEIDKYFVGLSSLDISRLSVTPSADIALLFTLCAKRVGDRLQDPLHLALLLDP